MSASGLPLHQSRPPRERLLAQPPRSSCSPAALPAKVGGLHDRSRPRKGGNEPVCSRKFRKCSSAGVTVGAVEPVAHRRLAGVAVGSAAQDVIKEGERFQLPGINRQVETRRRENQPLAISRRAGFFKKLIAAELMQVEVAENSAPSRMEFRSCQAPHRARTARCSARGFSRRSSS